MKKAGDSGLESSHIIVTEVPPGFLKRRNVRSHFSRFGTISRLSIQKTFCVITFESAAEAKDAVEHGAWWKDMPMKIDFTARHDPFASDDALINEELNWFAEEPDYEEKRKERSSKSKSESKHSHHRSSKSKLLFADDDNSKSSEEKRFKLKRPDSETFTSRKSEKRHSATSRFLDDMKANFKSEEKKRLKLSDGNKKEENYEYEEGEIYEGSDETKTDMNFGEGRELIGDIGVGITSTRHRSERKDFTSYFKAKGEESKHSDKSKAIPKLSDSSNMPSVHAVDSIIKSNFPNQLKSSADNNSVQFTFTSAFSDNGDNSKSKFPTERNFISDIDKLDKKVRTVEAVTEYKMLSEDLDSPSQTLGGTSQAFGTSSQVFGSFPQTSGGTPLASDTLGRASQPVGSTSQVFGSISPPSGGTSQTFGGTSEAFGSSSQVFGSVPQISGVISLASDASDGASQTLGRASQPVRSTPQFFGSSSQPSGGTTQVLERPSQTFGSASQIFGSTPQIFGSTPQVFGSVSQASGGASQVLGRPSQTFGSASQAFGVSSQVFGSISQASGSASQALGGRGNSTQATSRSLEDHRPSEDIKTILRPSDENKLLVKTSEAPIQKKVAGSLQEKLNLLEERDRLIRLKMDKSSKIDTAIQGTCPDMCPEKERVLRELMNIIAPYESLPDGKMDHSKAVKEYARSSADQEEPLPHDLRPEPVLTMTMTYLINCIISRIDEVGEENQSSWYDFCWGRLRAIRKDIIQQQLCDINTVVILEQCARFHIACYDRLWGTDKSHFDDKINTETLVNCLQSLIHMYEDLRREGVICPNEAEFIAYLILLKINSGFLMSEYQRYSKSLKESSIVKEAVKIHLAYNNNMYSTFFKLVKQTSYLNACLMQRFFQHIRIMALNTTIRAHCVPNKLTNISVKFLMDTLKLDLLDDCVSFCESVGLAYSDDDKTFRISRSDYLLTENSYKIETPSSLVVNKRIGIAEAVVGNTQSLPIYLNHTVHSSFNAEGILNENALDASDQEEKMLRDNVERKLLLSHLKTTFAHKLQVDDVIEVSSTSEESPVKIVASDTSMELTEEVDGELEESREERMFESEVETEDESISEESATSPIPSNVVETFSFSGHEGASLQSPKEKLFQSPKPTSPATTFPSSPLSAIPLSSSGLLTSSFKSPPTPIPSVNGSHLPTESLKTSSPAEKTESKIHFNISFKPSLQQKPNSPKEQDAFTPEWTTSSSKSMSKKTYCEDYQMDKLRQKLSENMKRILVHKYVKIWKDKVFKMKDSNECDAMALYNMSLKEHVMLWGKPALHRPLNLAGRLQTRKKSNLMVQMILNTDIIDKIAINVNQIGNAVVNALGEASVRKAEEWGNIARAKPVFWKLVFALPEPPPVGSTFSTKLKAWCKAAFHSYQVKMSQAGVPVFSTVTVVERLDEFQSSSNLTGLIVIRARHWETTEETESRIAKILNFRNSPIPLAVLHLGSEIDPVDVSHFKGLTHFDQFLWNNSQTITRVLQSLAQNVYLLNLSVKPFCSLLEEMSEKLFDLLQQDSYLDEKLEEALSHPNNIIYVYNQFLLKIQEEVVHCKVQNYFGTACEFKEHLENSNICFNFPDNYKDTNYEKAFSFRCKGCRLQPFKWEFKDSKEVISFLKEYCDEMGCSRILSKLVRSLNLPEDDTEVDMMKHLTTVRWLPFIETILKQLFLSPFLNFRVLYREDVIQNILQTRFWFDSLYA